MKKVAKILGVIFLLVLCLLIAVPFVLEAKIGDLIKTNVNSNINAKLDFTASNLSLIKSFPSATLNLKNVSLVNAAPFEGDTLFAARDVSLTLGIGELFKSAGDPIGIKRLALDGATINIMVNEEEQANYEIGKDSPADSPSTSEESEGFTLDLQSYEISSSKMVYHDKAAKIYFELADIKHSGTGDLSATTSELDTKTEAEVTFAMDSVNYVNKNKIKLDALIGVDLEANKYTFLKNEALINQLPLVFDGFIKLNDNSQEVAIEFKTPSSDFKNFLGIIPEAYSKNIDDVKTTGDFVLQGNFNGVVDETHIPKFHIKVNSNNASFKYPELPKSVKNVFIDVDIVNTTGVTEDTYVDIENLSFMIDQDTFKMIAKIKEIMGNMKVNAHLDGKMNLANIKKAYPVPADIDLKGILDADITTAFDMNSIEKKAYKNTQTSGSMSLHNFEYNSEEMANPVSLKTAALTFNPSTVSLNSLEGATGKTDFKATGTISNFLGYVFNDEKVQGNFDLKSNTFDLSDFMTADEPVKDKGTESNDGDMAAEEKIKIPSFLDATINASADKVFYDNLVLSDVKGSLRIKDEKAILNNMTSSIFDGKIAFNGEVSTKNEIPTFDMNLGMSKLEISKTFKSLALFKALAPIAQVLQGTLDSDIKLSGALTDDLTPDLLSLSGDVLANLFTKDVDAKSAPMLTSLAGELNFLDLKKLNFKTLKTKLSFKDGLVSVKPFTVNYQDIPITVEGSHSFDKNMSYKASMNVPAKYLGSEVTSLIAKMDDSELEDLTIPVTANIGGNYKNPKITSDIAGSVKSLSTKLIDIQKKKLLNKGAAKAKDLLGNLGANSSDENSNSTENTAKDVLGGLLGGGKKDAEKEKKDSVDAKQDDSIKEKAKDILGGFLGKKKKSKN